MAGTHAGAVRGWQTRKRNQFGGSTMHTRKQVLEEHKPARRPPPKRAAPVKSSTPKPAARASVRQPKQREAKPMAGQRAEARPGDRLAPVSYDDSMRIDPHGTPSVAQLQRIYGDRQLGAALTGYSHETLKAMARQVGAQPGRTSDETVSRITAKMTGGRYTANFRKR